MPTDTINWIKENWEILNLYFLSNVEYNDQVITQTNIHKSPLLKFKDVILCISPLDIIELIPNIDKTNPIIWKIFVLSIFINEDKIIVIAGIAARTKTALITWV